MREAPLRPNDERDEGASPVEATGRLLSLRSFGRRGYPPLTVAEAFDLYAGVAADLYPIDSMPGACFLEQIDRPPDRDTWLELRRPYVNASSAACLFDEHPFVPLGDFVRAKLDPTVVPAENDAMRRGRYLEPGIADWWADVNALDLVEPAVVYVNGWVMATLDRRIVGNDTDAVEIKSTAKYVSRPETYWVWQCQAQCYAAGLERVHLAVLDASQQLATYVIERDEAAIARLVERANEVMAHVSAGEWPPSVPTEKVQRHTDRTVELDTDAVAHLTAWLAVREQLHDLEALEAEHKAALVDVLGDAQAATVDGRQVLTYRSHTRTNIDLARLRAEHAELAAELSVAQVVRVLRPVDRSLLPAVTPLV